MPLPIAHSLTGYLCSEATKVRLAKKTWVNVFVFVVLANLPDFDFLPGYLMGRPDRYHHHLAHSLGFALFVGLVGGLFYFYRHRTSARRNHLPKEAANYRFWPYVLAIGGTVFSHCVLDLFNTDLSPPHGMVLLWPFDMRYYDLPLNVFPPVTKSNDSATFFISLLQWHNLYVVIWELLIMLPTIGLLKMIQRWRQILRRQRSAQLEKTQVARLGLLEASSLPPLLSGRRSLAAVVAEMEENEPYE
jgi:membrane-bound metal-dependent hydrolase YbcI (DUF457 family)